MTISFWTECCSSSIKYVFDTADTQVSITGTKETNTPSHVFFRPIIKLQVIAFSALTLLVGHQEEHQPAKN